MNTKTVKLLRKSLKAGKEIELINFRPDGEPVFVIKKAFKVEKNIENHTRRND